MYNTIIIYTIMAQDAEQILKYAEQIARCNWNVYGLKRLGSGYTTITTDGFGNPYNRERELKVFGIAIEVPEAMGYRTLDAYIDAAVRRTDCYTERYYTNI